MYANNERSSWEVVPAAEDSAADTFADNGGQEVLTAQDIGPQLNSEVAGQLNSGLLMGFLSDFRSAEYEQIRKKREEESAKTRKRPRPIPRPDLEDDNGVVYTETADYADTADYAGAAGYSEPPQTPQSSEVAWTTAPPEAEAQWTPQQVAAPSGVKADDFVSAACQPEPPGRKFRLPFGIATSKTIRESPATT